MTADENREPGPPIRDRANPLALLTAYERSMRASDDTSLEDPQTNTMPLSTYFGNSNADKGYCEQSI